MPDPKPHDVGFHEETTDPLVADVRNFFKVEKWTRDGTKVDSLLYAGNNLGRARAVFESAIKHRPRIRLTIRQRTRVLEQWPVQGSLGDPS
jgi:thiamine monophosphate kinase